MKKHFLLLIALFAASMFVMAEMTIYVYKKDGTKVLYVAAEVDSIGFADIVSLEAIDLGLPSGTKWANMNVGANSPEDYGDYFAWGETESKEEYNWSTYKWCEGSHDSQTKYCTSWLYGTTDNKTELELSDDAAYVNMGVDWRTPTKIEIQELINPSYTTWVSTTLNGVVGYKVTSKINGNSIFLPCAGNLKDSSSLFIGSIIYMSSSLSAYDSKDSFSMSMTPTSSSPNITVHQRFYGSPVRPVLRKSYIITFDPNDGEGRMEIFTLKEGESTTLPANTFTKSSSNFAGWNTAADGSGIAYTDQETITLTTNITLYAQWEKNTIGFENGHEWVDLGLPSGTKWATVNVGADSPEEYGNYFAWGEVEYKSEFTENNYMYEDFPSVLPLSADAANVNWGSLWRMPTDKEVEELTKYTECELISQNGVQCVKLTSSINGNSLLIPCLNLSNLFWSSNSSVLVTSNTTFYERGHIVCLSGNKISIAVTAPYNGNTIRPVLP